jgi:2-amino-4-hydroxy-6-hydroxymethyldihydropteridine diphosphokinase
VVAISPVYETEPVGGPPQPDYLNAVVAVETALSPRDLLAVGKALEAEAGREPPPGPGVSSDEAAARRWGPRPLDIDILLVGDERVDEPDLVVPHPRIHQRAFVLAPLADVAPELVVAPTAGWQGVRRCALQLQLPQPLPPPE